MRSTAEFDCWINLQDLLQTCARKWSGAESIFNNPWNYPSLDMVLGRSIFDGQWSDQLLVSVLFRALRRFMLEHREVSN